MDFNFKNELAIKLNLIEEELDKALIYKSCPQQRVIEAMRYSALNGGKRIRGLLTLSIGEAMGGDSKRLLPFSAAIEMVHTYSLIHDDLPCMDDDDYRRGKLSCHKAYDEATAVLAGDALLTLAFNKILSTEGIEDSKLVSIGKVLSVAIGEKGMIGGQVIDIENEGKIISEEILTKLHLLKTGELIKASAKIGAIVAGASKVKIKAIEEFSSCIGLAFQIQDDILDEIGDEETLGKPIGSDKDNLKTTYLTLYGIENAKKMCEQLYNQGITALKSQEIYTEFIEALIQSLMDRTF